MSATTSALMVFVARSRAPASGAPRGFALDVLRGAGWSVGDAPIQIRLTLATSVAPGHATDRVTVGHRPDADERKPGTHPGPQLRCSPAHAGRPQLTRVPMVLAQGLDETAGTVIVDPDAAENFVLEAGTTIVPDRIAPTRPRRSGGARPGLLSPSMPRRHRERRGYCAAARPRASQVTKPHLSTAYRQLQWRRNVRSLTQDGGPGRPNGWRSWRSPHAGAAGAGGGVTAGPPVTLRLAGRSAGRAGGEPGANPRRSRRRGGGPAPRRRPHPVQQPR